MLPNGVLSLLMHFIGMSADILKCFPKLDYSD